ncbi:hypothetical protein K456DRAFT_807719 [Colletotrichum gloeosporioides 23]|nr:hypothetical protein K456DRAFT_807719 [Colletotrichum gloeosporioides 23]
MTARVRDCLSVFVASFFSRGESFRLQPSQRLVIGKRSISAREEKRTRGEKCCAKLGRMECWHVAASTSQFWSPDGRVERLRRHGRLGNRALVMLSAHRWSERRCGVLFTEKAEYTEV